jgi:putative transposase
VNIGMKGLEILGINPSKLLHQEVTTKSELTDLARNSQEISIALAVEPSNPQQLILPYVRTEGLFEWRNGGVIPCSESPVTASVISY